MLNIHTRSLLAVCIAAACLSSACGGGPQTGRSRGEGRVAYDDPKAVETVTMGFGSTDLQNTAEGMTQSLLASRWIAEAAHPPRIRLREVANYTEEHIDTKGITDKIRVKLLKSGKVRFLADSRQMEDLELERELTANKTERAGNTPLLDSTYIITGSVRSIAKATKKAGDVYYLITLEMVDSQQGEVVWADEQEFRKVTDKPYLGW